MAHKDASQSVPYMDEQTEADAAIYQLASIVESSDDAMISKTLDGVITNWNSSAEKLFGYTADEAIGQSIFLVIPPDRQEEWVEIVARLRAGEIVKNYETTRVRKDGTCIDVSVTVSPILDAERRNIGVTAIFHDITEQKRMIEDLATRSHELESSNKKLATRSQELENSNKKLATRTQQLEGSVEELATRSQELEGSVEELATRSQELESSNKKLVTRTQQLEGSVEKLATRSQELEGSVEELATRSQELEGSVEELATRSQELENSNKKLATRTQQLESSNKKLATRSQELEGSVEELATRSQELESSVEELATRSQELESSNRKLATRSQELESSNKKLATRSQELERTRSRLRAIIDASQDAMLLLAPDGRPIEVNTRFTDFFELDDTTVLAQSADLMSALLIGKFIEALLLGRSLARNSADQGHIFREQLVQVGPGDGISISILCPLSMSIRPILGGSMCGMTRRMNARSIA